ncbi:Hypothetical predicted protein [Marmota monax]|uniref:Uncharacterized protein n=1 Tax=Marmota monax TaxID=9995 RepID=A0A5E4ADF2_MARMO|nr:Hypothetical predicted protein [Marmota monax]
MPTLGSSASSLLGQQANKCYLSGLDSPLKANFTPPSGPVAPPHSQAGLTPRLLLPSALPSPSHPGASFLLGPAALPYQAQGPTRIETPLGRRAPVSSPSTTSRRPSPYKPHNPPARAPPLRKRKVPVPAAELGVHRYCHSRLSAQVPASSPPPPPPAGLALPTSASLPAPSFHCTRKPARRGTKTLPPISEPKLRPPPDVALIDSKESPIAEYTSFSPGPYPQN